MSPKSRMPRFAHGGFTLIEIAVVLLVLGLLTVYGARLVASIAEGTRTRVTRQNMESIKLAVQAYVARTGRMPCPAVEVLTPADALFGVEAPNGGTCTATQALDAVAFRGTVPWKTLGMTTDNAYDGWGNQITYVVSGPATNLSAATISGMRGTIYVHSATPVVAGRPATGNQINACSVTADDNGCNGAAVLLLLSHGNSGAGAFTSGGVQTPAPTSAQELENTDNDRNFVMSEPGPNFDDLVYPFTPNDILGPLFVQGVVRAPEGLTVERARNLVALMAAYSVANRSGVSPNYQYPLTPAGPPPISAYAGLPIAMFDGDCFAKPPTTVYSLPADLARVVDPWNNSYRYAQAHPAVLAGTTCETPAAFVSLGPDGLLNTADDIVYYAPLAEWKEIFQRSGW